MRPRIVLVGVGGVGRFHLLGLAKSEDFALQAVDLSERAIGEATALLARDGLASRVEFVRDIAQAWSAPDLTIVATQARGRGELVDALLARGHRTFILEKLVCQRELDYERLTASLEAVRARAWVVAPLRYNPFYDSIDRELHGERIALHVTGNDLGLATNGIHIADLFERLRGTWSVRFDVGLIARDILPNKRGTDLVEFGGTLGGSDDSGSVLTVTNLPFSQVTQTIAITSEKLWCVIDVPRARAHVARRAEDWRVDSVPYQESYVSAVTPVAAADVLHRGSCRFPTLAEMFPIHRELFRAFRAALGAVRHDVPDVLPVT